MIKLPKANFTARLKLIGCCMANKGYNLGVSLSLGRSCIEDVKLFEYYSILLEILKCYNMDDALTTDEQDEINCLTYEEVMNIFNKFSDYCSQCFPKEFETITYCS